MAERHSVMHGILPKVRSWLPKRKSAGAALLVAICLTIASASLSACSEPQSGSSESDDSPNAAAVSDGAMAGDSASSPAASPASVISDASAASASAASAEPAASSASSASSVDSSATNPAASSQSASQKSADEERQAEIERLTNLEKAYQQTVEEKDTWADGIVVDSLNKLAKEGAIAPLPKDFVLFDKVFEFKKADDGFDIDFLDDATEKRLTGDFALDLSDGSKVAICNEYHMLDSSGKRAYDVQVLYTDKDGAFSIAVYKHDEELLATPTLMPYGEHKLGSFLDPEIPQEVFADNLDECRYLIAYGSCYSNVVENYYSISPTAEGSFDRTDVTTIVLVIDAQERAVLHIENIGTDIPGGSVDAAKSEHFGKMLTDEALAYISKLLLNQ